MRPPRTTNRLPAGWATLGGWLVLATIFVPAASAAEGATPARWPGWRGHGSGVSADGPLPVVWDATEGVAWKTPLPGEGNSSPIVWDGKVFLTASTDKGKKRLVICLDAAGGKVLWQRAVEAKVVPETYPKNGYASPTPVTDGRRVYAFFDSPGLVAFDAGGKHEWTCEFGPYKSPWNLAAGPVLAGDLVVVCCDHQGESFIVGVRRDDGKVAWRTARPGTLGFATPLVIARGGRQQVIVNGAPVVAYDAATGKAVWSCHGMNRENPVPSAIYHAGLVYVTTGRDGPSMAIDPTGSGDVTETHVRMHVARGGPYVPSPLVLGGRLLLPGDNGVVRVFDRAGRRLLRRRVRGHFSASPVVGDGKVYWTCEKGNTYVLDVRALAGDKPALTVLARNALGERCFASPTVAGGRLLLRGTKHLFCIRGAAPEPKTVAAKPPAATFAQLKPRYAKHPAAKGPDVGVRIEVVEALAGVKGPQVVAFLLRAAEADPHWDVSEAAAKSLGAHGQDARQAAVKLLDDHRFYLKIIAAGHLQRLAHAEAVAPLVKQAAHADRWVRVACVRALAAIAAAEAGARDAALPVLAKRLEDAEGVVAQAAIEAAASLAGKCGTHRDALVAGLLKAAAHKNAQVAKLAGDVLVKQFKVPQADVRRAKAAQPRPK